MSYGGLMGQTSSSKQSSGGTLVHTFIRRNISISSSSTILPLNYTNTLSGNTGRKLIARISASDNPYGADVQFIGIVEDNQTMRLFDTNKSSSAFIDISVALQSDGWKLYVSGGGKDAEGNSVSYLECLIVELFALG